MNKDKFTSYLEEKILAVKPQTEILNHLLTQFDVTKTKSIRYYKQGGKFISFINHMNKKVKIVSSSLITAFVVIALVFIFNSSDSSFNQKKKPVSSVVVSGETVNLDSLLADLDSDDDTTEPVYSDEDLASNLINSNYEIQ